MSEGSLIELPDFAKKFHVPGRLFATPHIMKRYGAKGSYTLEGYLFIAVDMRLRDTGKDRYGPDDQQDYVSYFAPHEQFGHVLVIAEPGRLEELGVELATGEGLEYAM